MWVHKTSLAPPLFIVLSVTSQKSHRSSICVLGVSILQFSATFVLGFGNVPTVWYLFFHFILLCISSIIYIIYIFIKNCWARLLSNYNIKYICTIYTRLYTCLISIFRFALRDKVTLRLLKLLFLGSGCGRVV
jgi:hypothetical protein